MGAGIPIDIATNARRVLPQAKPSLLYLALPIREEKLENEIDYEGRKNVSKRTEVRVVSGRELTN